MKRIVIGIDYDPTAEKVAQTAYNLFIGSNVGITLLHVVANEVYYSSRAYSPIMGFTGFVPTEPIEGEQTQFLMEAGAEYLEKTRDFLGDVNISTIVKEGNFADTILETAEELNADLIVVGSHSRRWLEKIVMGSVTEAILRLSKIPVLVVPTGKENKGTT